MFSARLYKQKDKIIQHVANPKRAVHLASALFQLRGFEGGRVNRLEKISCSFNYARAIFHRTPKSFTEIWKLGQTRTYWKKRTLSVGVIIFNFFVTPDSVFFGGYIGRGNFPLRAMCLYDVRKRFINQSSDLKSYIYYDDNVTVSREKHVGAKKIYIKKYTVKKAIPT